MNIVTEQPGWILHRCAQELAIRLPHVTVNGDRAAADLNYYMPAYCWTHPRDEDLAIGLWTHPSPERVARFSRRYCANVTMNQRVAGLLRDRRAARVVTIRPGVATRPRPVTFGVCGRLYKTGRKGEHLVAQMVRAGYDVVAWGEGWPCRIFSDQVDHLSLFYKAITYLVVTSTEEGGPMPVVDALAHGVPVIAPDVGWCWEFPVIQYDGGSWPSLHAILRGLTELPTWEHWASAHAALLAELEVAHGVARADRE